MAQGKGGGVRPCPDGFPLLLLRPWYGRRGTGSAYTLMVSPPSVECVHPVMHDVEVAVQKLSASRP